MKSAAYLTITGMINLQHFGKENVFILKYEDLIYNLPDTIFKLCKFLNINDYKIDVYKKIKVHNLLYLYFTDKNKIPKHTTNKKLIKNNYLKYWNDNLEKEFNQLFPKNLINKLGY